MTMRTAALTASILPALLILSAPLGADTTTTTASRKGTTMTVEQARAAAVPTNDLCRQADKLRVSGKRKAAMAMYEKALTEDPSLDVCRYWLGVCQFQEGQYEEALENLKRTVAAAPNPSEAYNWVARAKAEMGDIEGALEIWRTLLEQDPKFAEAHYRMAMVYNQQGDDKKAREHLQEALKLDPNDKPAKTALKKLK